MNKKIYWYWLGFSVSLLGGFFPHAITSISLLKKYELVPSALGEGFYYFTLMFTLLIVLEYFRLKKIQEGKSSYFSTPFFTQPLHPIVLFGTGIWLLFAAKNHVFCTDEEVNFFVSLGGIIVISVAIFQIYLSKYAQK